MINLLPDVRQAKLKEHRRRQLASGIAVMTWVVCGGLVVLLTVIVTGQNVAKSLLTRSIASKEQNLQKVSGLTDALTAQEHLQALSGLYSQRVYMTKFFEAYQAADPVDVTIGAMTIDSDNLMTVSGAAKTYAGVAKLDRALAASNVSVGSAAAASNSPYFTNVQITSLSKSNVGLSYTLQATLGSNVTAPDQAGPTTGTK